MAENLPKSVVADNVEENVVSIRQQEEKARLRDRSLQIHSDRGAQEIKVSSNFAKFMCPCRVIVCGNSHSGKTRLLLELIKYREKVFSCVFSRIIYSLPKDNVGVNTEAIGHLRESYPQLQVEHGFACSEEWNLIPNLSRRNVLIILEDQYPDLVKSQSFEDLLIRHSHHHNLSVIVTTQNYFTRSDRSATLLRQYSYIVAFHARIERTWLVTLGARVSSNVKCLEQAFEWMSANLALAPLQYVVIDGSPLTHVPRPLTIRSQITPLPGSTEIKPIFFCLAEGT
jgi:hypothetical protein